MTKKVICSLSFHTSTVRHVTNGEKHQVEVWVHGEGLRLHPGDPSHPLVRLGGSNDIAGLYPDEDAFSSGVPGFHIKDKLENKPHDLVRSGAAGLRTAQRRIAPNWEKFYSGVYGVVTRG